MQIEKRKQKFVLFIETFTNTDVSIWEECGSSCTFKCLSRLWPPWAGPLSSCLPPGPPAPRLTSTLTPTLVTLPECVSSCLMCPRLAQAFPALRGTPHSEAVTRPPRPCGICSPSAPLHPSVPYCPPHAPLCRPGLLAAPPEPGNFRPQGHRRFCSLCLGDLSEEHPARSPAQLPQPLGSFLQGPLHSGAVPGLPVLHRTPSPPTNPP